MKGADLRLSEQHWSTVERLLDGWFNAQHTRKDKLPFRSSQVPSVLAVQAGRMYKRGAAALIDLDTNTEISLHTERDNDEFLPKAAEPVSTWEEFYDRHIRSSSAASGVLILDSGVATHHPKIVAMCKNHGLAVHGFESGEENKTLAQARQIYQAIAEQTETVFVVGGGICCDVGAFVASLLGLRIVLVPTTLLATVDAALGGKTGVNHPTAGKNQIGLFATIDQLVPVQELLCSIPQHLVLDGLAEILKHAWLKGSFPEWSEAIEKLLHTPAHQSLMDVQVFELIRANLQFKKSVVTLDPFEQNLRMMLNLGHTLGHLLESYNLKIKDTDEHQPELSHGMAVCLGILCLLDNGLLGSEPAHFPHFRKMLLDILRVRGLQRPLFRMSQQPEVVARILAQDKKNQVSQQVLLVVPGYAGLSRQPPPEPMTDFMSRSTQLMSAQDILGLLKKSGIVE